MTQDTIAACATPPGRGGIAVTRVSGPAVPDIARRLLGRLPRAREASYARFIDSEGQAIDRGLAIYFEAPNSFTGEEVLELHGHGGAVVVDALLERLVELGARRARPGEFSERAYLNDKLDLAQAEAIADLIDAGSRSAARAAMRSLQGEFSTQVNAIREQLIMLRVQIEAGIDFPDEHLDLAQLAGLRAKADRLQKELASLLASASQGRVLNEGLTIVIAGRPNAGKSTLLNRLSGHDAAIVTPVPGTTRDLLRERVEIGGVPMELIDTAGLRASTPDLIEAEGMRRARGAIAQADHVLFVVDAVEDPQATSFEQERAALPEGVAVTIVMNKMDVAHRAGTLPGGALGISAATGDGIDALRAFLARLAAPAEGVAGTFSARARHVDALKRAAAQLDAAREQLKVPQLELAAEELRAAQQSLGEVTGHLTSDQLLGEIFSRFCIGK